MNQKTAKYFGIGAITVAALIWGTAFAAQRSGMDYMPPVFFNGVRSFIGVLALLPVIMMLDRAAGRKMSFYGAADTPAARRTLVIGGISCGIVLSVAALLQQCGIVYASAGKAGFLTALYIVIVPILGLFFKRKASPLLWFAAVAALGGSWLLCTPNGGSVTGGVLNAGDYLLIGCAAAFSGHIMVVDHFAPKVDCVRLSCFQFFVAGCISLAASRVLGEAWDWSAVYPALTALLYCGIGSSGIAYTLQIVGQKYVHPVAASLVMSLESVFAVLGGYVVLGEKLTPRELTGCAVIFAAVILAQIPPKMLKKD